MGERTATHSEDSVSSEDFLEPLMEGLDDELPDVMDDAKISICSALIGREAAPGRKAP
jgi:hypothetical protein